jgi:hypothetical protein
LKRRGRQARLLPAVAAATVAAILAGAGAAAFAAFESGQAERTPQAQRHFREKEQIVERDTRPQPGPVRAPSKDSNQRPPSERPRRPVGAGRVHPYAGSGLPVPAPAAAFACTTYWLDLQGGTYFGVYGGYRPTGSGQGALLVRTANATTGADGPGGLFDAPGKTGALRLTAVRGNTVYFSYPGGHGTFDLVTQRYSPGR